MQSVNIGELKNNLSHYLRQVRKGNEVIIKDRNRIIARIVPAAPQTDYEEEMLELAAQGKIRLAEKPLTEEIINEMLNLPLPRPKTRGKAAKTLLKRIMDEERGPY
ncbi:MAG: type II toxin-antitoxin system prevent-host-death family antitoxin [Acidobacteriota bacterium]